MTADYIRTSIMIKVERQYMKSKHILYLPELEDMKQLVYQRIKGCFKGYKIKYSKQGTPIITFQGSNYRLVDLIYHKMGHSGYTAYYRDQDKTNLSWDNIRPYEDHIPVKVTQDLVKRLFNYSNGDLIWLKSSWKGRKAGLIIRIDGKSYLRSHLVWLYFKGIKPKRLTHKNGDKSDTRIENLRIYNFHIDHPRAKSSNNVRGVYKRGKKYLAFAYRSGKQILLGSFKTLRRAYEERKKFFITNFQLWCDKFPDIMNKEDRKYFRSKPARQNEPKLRQRDSTTKDLSEFKVLLKGIEYPELPEKIIYIT